MLTVLTDTTSLVVTKDVDGQTLICNGLVKEALGGVAEAVASYKREMVGRTVNLKIALRGCIILV